MFLEVVVLLRDRDHALQEEGVVTPGAIRDPGAGLHVAVDHEVDLGK